MLHGKTVVLRNLGRRGEALAVLNELITCLQDDENTNIQIAVCDARERRNETINEKDDRSRFAGPSLAHGVGAGGHGRRTLEGGRCHIPVSTIYPKRSSLSLSYRVHRQLSTVA
jgi:hypothetical protein